MSGGLIHQYKRSKLEGARDPQFYTDAEKAIIELLRVNADAKVQPVGSLTFPIQRFPGDIDLKQDVVVRDPKAFARELQNLVKRLTSIARSEAGIFFSDFKAGIAKDGSGAHWTAKQVMQGRRGNLPLYKAITQKSVVKLDVLILHGDRVIEASSFFVLMRPDGSYINIPENFFEIYHEILKEDIREFWRVKPFKALKRLWNLSRLTRDTKTLEILAPAIDSSLSVLSQVVADLESVILLIANPFVQWGKTTAPRIRRIIDSFLRRLSTIADIDVPLPLMESIKALKTDLSLGMLEFAKNQVAELLKVETEEFIRSVGLTPP